jgi:inorganic phosphate transporter, PiT family
LIWFYLISGLFLGWSLGANDASNIFGTAVTTKMLKFRFAATLASIFLVLGAVFSGGGTSQTISELGEVNALAGAFTVSLASGLTVFVLIRRGFPVSVSQSIVGSIIAWCIFTATPVDISSLTRIIITWVFNPVISCVFAYLIFLFTKYFIKKVNIHLLEIDFYTRLALILVLIFGSYSLGANNIAKVIGVFINSNPFNDINILNVISFPAAKQLFLLGGLAMAIGIFTYSKRNIETVGGEIFKLDPITALSSVLGSSLVLFLFSSQSIENLLHSVGLPGLPLVPVSITQSMVGAIIGISFAKGVSNLNFKVLGKIGIGWVITPIVSGLVCFILLFFVQNVFQAKIVFPINYEITPPVLEELKKTGLPVDSLMKFQGTVFNNQYEFRKSLNDVGIDKEENLFKIFNISKIEYFSIDSNIVNQKLSLEDFSIDDLKELKILHSKSYKHRWQVINELSNISPAWKFLEDTPMNKYFNNNLKTRYEIIFDTFKAKESK